MAFSGSVEGVVKKGVVKKRAAKAVAEQAASNAQAFNDQIDTWLNESKADPKIGGDKFDENIAFAIKAIDKHGTPEARQILNDSGLGNNPHILTLLVNAGKALGESSVEKPSATTSSKSISDKFYDK